MNTRILTIVVIFLISLSPTLSQENNDTTKISIGKNKIIIIKDEKEKEEKKLKLAILEFKQEIAIAKDSITKLEKQKQKLNNKNKEIKIETEIEDYKKQINAFKKGINEIEDEIALLNNDTEENSHNKKNDWEWSWNKHKHKKFNGHWAGLDIGINTFMNKNNEMNVPENAEFMELKASSWAFNLNLLEYSLEVVDERAGFVIGAGFEWNNYNFKNNIRLYETEQGIIDGLNVDYEFEKNKLHTGYFSFPLLFEIQTKQSDRNKRFFISAGVVGGVKFATKTVQKFKKDGNRKKLKDKSDYQVNTLKYSGMVRMGYCKLQVFGAYDFVPLFKKNKGPELYPLTVGMILSL